MNQGYYAYVDEEDRKHGTNYYKNLRILPKNQGSVNTLTNQLSQANSHFQNGPNAGNFGNINMQSLKNQVFNINSEI